MRCMNMTCVNFNTKVPHSCDYLANPTYEGCRSFFTVGINDEVITSVIEGLTDPINMQMLGETANLMSLMLRTDAKMTNSRKELLAENLPKIIVLLKHLAGENSPDI